jgi:TolA-binding protein
VGMQRSVILEKQSKFDEAIKVLEELAKNKEGMMNAKVSLELGRLNLAKNDIAKANTHFDYVLNTYPNDEYAKLAKLYKAKIAQ